MMAKTKTLEVAHPRRRTRSTAATFFRILRILIRHLNKGEVQVSSTALAKEIGVSRRTLRNYGTINQMVPTFFHGFVRNYRRSMKKASLGELVTDPVSHNKIVLAHLFYYLSENRQDYKVILLSNQAEAVTRKMITITYEHLIVHWPRGSEIPSLQSATVEDMICRAARVVIDWANDTDANAFLRGKYVQQILRLMDEAVRHRWPW